MIQQDGLDARTHNYSTPGVKDITITGSIQGWSFGASSCDYNTGSGDRNKLLEISNWGSTPMRLDSPTEKDYYFCNADNLVITATGGPNLSATESLKGAFMGTDNFNSSIANWDVSNIEDMSYMFYSASKFNQPLNAWGNKTSNVTNMQYMFSKSPWIGAGTFNQSLTSWNTGSVTNMENMFNGASQFAGDRVRMEHRKRHQHAEHVQRGIQVQQRRVQLEHGEGHEHGLHVPERCPLQPEPHHTGRQVEHRPCDEHDPDVQRGDCFQRFIVELEHRTDHEHAVHVRQHGGLRQDISAWDTSRVTNMTGMFQSATAFNSPLNDWGSKTAAVTTTRQMFMNASGSTSRSTTGTSPTSLTCIGCSTAPLPSTKT